ncbi:hypothetical protein Tco_1095544 [Tanacetum coccineum]
MYEKIKRSDEDFIAIGSVEDESLIKKMKKKDSSKGEEIKQESKEEVKEEDKDEENTRKRKHGTRKKMKSRKRRFKQDTSQDDPSDIEKENDELRLCLTIAPDEDKEIDESKRSEEINMNVVTRSNGQKRSFSTLMRVLSVFDREDLDAVYKLVMNIYQDKIPEERTSMNEYSQLRAATVLQGKHYCLMTDEGLVVHMLIEKKYPLKKEILGNQLTLLLGEELASPRSNSSGKENGLQILQSIDQGPFELGTTRSSKLTKEDRESQLYDEFERFKMLSRESINEYYVRFHKLVNDMRNIIMIMSNIQLNSKFVNNMSPEWDRFVTAVKLNKGLKETNHEQLYAYLKQHEKHAAQDQLIIEKITRTTNDPLAFVSTVQPYAQQSRVQSHQYPSSSAPSQSTYVPSLQYPHLTETS